MGKPLSPSTETHAQRASRNISNTPDDWQSYYAKKLSDQDTKDIQENVSAFFSILEEWDHPVNHEDIAHPLPFEAEDRSLRSNLLDSDQDRENHYLPPTWKENHEC